MTYFNAIIIIALAVLGYATLEAALSLWHLRRRMRNDTAMLGRLSGALRNGATLPYAASRALDQARLRPVLGLLWKRMQQGGAPSDVALQQVEDEEVAAPVHRAQSVTGIAPACGLLGTTAGIAVGLFAAQSNPAEASTALIAALPAALMSTFAALLMAIILRVQISATVARWNHLRNQALNVIERSPPTARVPARQTAQDGPVQELLP